VCNSNWGPRWGQTYKGDRAPGQGLRSPLWLWNQCRCNCRCNWSPCIVAIVAAMFEETITPCLFTAYDGFARQWHSIQHRNRRHADARTAITQGNEYKQAMDEINNTNLWILTSGSVWILTQARLLYFKTTTHPVLTMWCFGSYHACRLSAQGDQNRVCLFLKNSKQF